MSDENPTTEPQQHIQDIIFGLLKCQKQEVIVRYNLPRGNKRDGYPLYVNTYGILLQGKEVGIWMVRNEQKEAIVAIFSIENIRKVDNYFIYLQ